MIEEMLDIVPVIEGDLFAFANVAQGIEVEPTIFIDHLGIRLTGVVDQSCWIPLLVPVEIMRLIEVKNVDGSPTCMLRRFEELIASAIRLLFVDEFTAVFNDLAP